MRGVASKTRKLRVIREWDRKLLPDAAFERVFGALVEYIDRFDLLDDDGGFFRPHGAHFSQHNGGLTLGNVLATAEDRGILRRVGARWVFM